MLSVVWIVVIGIAVTLVLLCIFAKIFATKYIRGDFSKDDFEDEEKDGLLDQPYHDEPEEPIKKKIPQDGPDDDMIIHFDEDTRKMSEVPLYEPPQYQPQVSHYQPQESGGDTSSIQSDQETEQSKGFLTNARLKSELVFNEVTNSLKGTFTYIEGLNIKDKDAPHLVNFHLKIIPKNRFRMKTRWKPVDQIASPDKLTLSFTMGPIRREDLIDSKLGVKLYGKKQSVLAGHKFYGGLYISLGNLAENDQAINYSTPFLPKGGGTDSIYLTSESETE